MGILTSYNALRGGHKEGQFTDLLQCPQGRSSPQYRGDHTDPDAGSWRRSKHMRSHRQSTAERTGTVRLRGGGYYRTKLCSHTGYNMVIQGIW